MWLVSFDEPEHDSDGSRVIAKAPIDASTAAEIAMETEDDISDGDQLDVWVWLPGQVSMAVVFSVSASMSWAFVAKQNAATNAEVSDRHE